MNCAPTHIPSSNYHEIGKQDSSLFEEEEVIELFNSFSQPLLGYNSTSLTYRLQDIT